MLKKLEKGLGRPAGALLKQLFELAPREDDLQFPLEEDDIPEGFTERGVTFLGRTDNGYFGVSTAALGETLAESRWVYADRQGLDPFAFASLADFLSFWAYAPSFFEATASADTWEQEHERFFSGRGATVEGLRDAILELDGVREIKSGQEMATLAATCEPVELKRTFRTPESACEGLAEEILSPTLMADVVDVEVERKKVIATLMCFCPEDRLQELLALPAFKEKVAAFRSGFQSIFPSHQLELCYECDPSGTDDRFAVVLRHNKASAGGR